MKLHAFNRIVGASLLVAGTCIGAGMLGFPIETAAGGFQTSLLFFIGVWLIMTFTAFLMVEVACRFPQEVNLISMARATLGKPGAVFAWLVYISFFYALMTAYTSGGASIVVTVFNQWSPHTVSMEHGTLFLVGTLAVVLYIGTTWVDWFNRVLMIGLVATYGALILGAVPRVDQAYIEVPGQIKYLWSAIPLLITAFGFHLSLPSLKTYLHHNLTWLRISVLCGSFLSLLVYILWEYVILGIIPHEQLIAMSQSGNSVTELTNAVQFVLQAPWITNSIQLFMLFALMTSFIGVSLGIFDFFADGLKVSKNPLGKLLLLFLTLGIPTLCSFWDPAIFLQALSYGGFFGAILLIGFPAVMAWRSRVQFKTGYRVWGGVLPLLLVIAFGILVVVLRISGLLGLLPAP